MGHLLSRAFRRLTQGGSQSRNQQPEQQNDREQQDNGNNNSASTSEGRPLTESIPVGQSLDSSDYAEFDTSNTRTRISTTTTTTARIDQEKTNAPAEANKVANGDNLNGASSDETDEKQGVEEAVIKIQALVRGHLARKALKDAHHNSLPSTPNALGQSQFDENNLLRDPPSAIFSQLTLNGLDETQARQPVTLSNSRIQSSNGIDSQRTSLDPIAEVPVDSSNQTTSTTTTTTTTTKQPETSIEVHKSEDERKKLSLICSRSASSPSQLEMPRTDSMNRDSLSPVPSEANASIDLNCDTPASASIDITTSNIIPTGNMASVLHHKLDDCNDRARELAEAAVALVDDDDYDDVAQIEIGRRDETGEPSSMRLTINENGVSGTPDSLESEEAAAIRIQSAFRGYRSRKNSPYRTRSPSSSISKRNVLIQQEATILDENDDQIVPAARVTNHGAELAQGVVDSAEASESGESVLPPGERRSSRVRQRDCSDLEQQPNQRAPSADEFTATEDDTTQASTVRSVLGQHQKGGHNESAAAAADGAVESVRNSDKKREASMEGKENDKPSFSLEAGESEPNTLDELAGLSSALETGQTTASVGTNGNDQVTKDENNSMSHTRPSLGYKSENSVETYDTDSSVLGAALSLNEDSSAADLSRGSDLPTSGHTTEQQTSANIGPALDTIDEGKFLGYNIQSQVDEALQPSEGGALIEEDEEEDQAMAATREALNVLDELEQRAIEMESDDIERRDPRGQVSEERAKSPQIRLDEPQFAITSESGIANEAEDAKQEEAGERMGEGNGSGVNLLPGHGDESGRSSPALNNSSAANSSSEDDSDQAQRDVKSPGGDDANRKQQQAAKNKKRNNRNKRKGKK